MLTDIHMDKSAGTHVDQPVATYTDKSAVLTPPVEVGGHGAQQSAGKTGQTSNTPLINHWVMREFVSGQPTNFSHD